MLSPSSSFQPTSPYKTMKTFIRTAMKNFLEMHSGSDKHIKASEMWIYIKQCYPNLEQTKYRPSIVKSLWSSINHQFSNAYTLIYDIKQGPALKYMKNNQQVLDEHHNYLPSLYISATMTAQLSKVNDETQSASSFLLEDRIQFPQSNQQHQFLFIGKKRNLFDSQPSPDAKRKKEVDQNFTIDKTLLHLAATSTEENNQQNSVTYFSDLDSISAANWTDTNEMQELDELLLLNEL